MTGYPYLLTLALLAPLAGALVVALTRDVQRAQGACIGALAACVALVGAAAVQAHLVGYGAMGLALGAFGVDSVAAPVLPVIGLVHLLAAVGTAKSRVNHGRCVRLLLSALFTLAAATSATGPGLILMMAAAAVLPAWDLKALGRSMRGYLVYMVPALVLIVAGWMSVDGASRELSSGLMIAGLLVYGGMAPGHAWTASLFERGSFGASMGFVLPILPLVGLIRLVLPVAPEPVLETAGWFCLFTGVYAGGLATVQASVRRFYAYLALSQLSMVLFAVLQASAIGVTAALCLWISAALCLAGLGFPARAIEARFGRLSLREAHGLYSQIPTLAVSFLVAGLACVGFPGTFGFVPIELLISGSFEQGRWVSAALAATAMLSGIAILRAYFALFTGKRTSASVSLQATPVERFGIVVIAVVVLLGGWLAPPLVASRHALADQLVAQRGP
jgi:NADH-quinone oxidoreductase subunit M